MPEHDSVSSHPVSSTTAAAPLEQIIQREEIKGQTSSGQTVEVMHAAELAATVRPDGPSPPLTAPSNVIQMDAAAKSHAVAMPTITPPLENGTTTVVETSANGAPHEPVLQGVTAPPPPVDIAVSPALEAASRIPAPPPLPTPLPPKPKVDKLKESETMASQCEQEIQALEAKIKKAETSFSEQATPSNETADHKKDLVALKLKKEQALSDCETIKNRREAAKCRNDLAVKKFDKAFLDFVTKSDLKPAEPGETPAFVTEDSKRLAKWQSLESTESLQKMQETQNKLVEEAHSKMVHTMQAADEIKANHLARKEEIMHDAIASNPKMLDVANDITKTYEERIAKEQQLADLKNCKLEFLSKLQESNLDPSQLDSAQRDQISQETKRLDEAMSQLDSELQNLDKHQEENKALLPDYIYDQLIEINDQKQKLIESQNTPKVFTMEDRKIADDKTREVMFSYCAEISRLKKGDLSQTLQNIQGRINASLQMNSTNESKTELKEFKKELKESKAELSKGNQLPKMEDHASSKSGQQPIGSSVMGSAFRLGGDPGALQSTETTSGPTPLPASAEVLPSFVAPRTATPQPTIAPHVQGMQAGAHHAAQTPEGEVLASNQGGPAVQQPVTAGPTPTAPLTQNVATPVGAQPQPLQLFTTRVASNERLETTLQRVQTDKANAFKMIEFISNKNGLNYNETLNHSNLYEIVVNKRVPIIFNRISDNSEFQQIVNQMLLWDQCDRDETTLQTAIKKRDVEAQNVSPGATEMDELDALLADLVPDQGPALSSSATANPMAAHFTATGQAAQAQAAAAAGGIPGTPASPQPATARDTRTEEQQRLRTVEASGGPGGGGAGSQGGRGGDQQGAPQSEIIFKKKTLDPVTGNYTVTVSLRGEDYVLTAGGLGHLSETGITEHLQKAETQQRILNMVKDFENLSKLYEGKNARITLTTGANQSKEVNVTYTSRAGEEKQKVFTNATAEAKIAKWEGTIENLKIPLERKRAVRAAAAAGTDTTQLDNDIKQFEKLIAREQAKQAAIRDIFGIAIAAQTQARPFVQTRPARSLPLQPIPERLKSKPMPPTPPKAAAAQAAAAPSQAASRKPLPPVPEKLSRTEFDLLSQREKILDKKWKADKKMEMYQTGPEFNQALEDYEAANGELGAFDQLHPGLIDKQKRIEERSAAKAQSAPSAEENVDELLNELAAAGFKGEGTFTDADLDALLAEQAPAQPPLNGPPPPPVPRPSPAAMAKYEADKAARGAAAANASAQPAAATPAPSTPEQPPETLASQPAPQKPAPAPPPRSVTLVKPLQDKRDQIIKRLNEANQQKSTGKIKEANAELEAWRKEWNALPNEVRLAAEKAEREKNEKEIEDAA